MTRWLIVISCSAALSSSACKNDTGCERARLDLAKTWTELRQAATRRKLEGADTRSWTEIEKKAELLESSFTTRQVTWESANRATREIASALPALTSDQDARLTSFRNSAESAIKQQGSFEKQCR